MPMWNLTLLLHRQKTGQPAALQKYAITIDPDEYVLDAVERIWAFQDRSLTFRHACHHSTCGACGMRVNNTEKLTCITRLRDITSDGGTVKIEPLRNFPVISDLAVDMRHFYLKMEAVHARQVIPLSEAPAGAGIAAGPEPAPEGANLARLADCIECGLCISACPSQATSITYLGPAVLAAAQQNLAHSPDTLALAASSDGVWRCHSAFECTEVCPSNVEPAWRIMDLRKQIIKTSLARWFSPLPAHERS